MNGDREESEGSRRHRRLNPEQKATEIGKENRGKVPYGLVKSVLTGKQAKKGTLCSFYRRFEVEESHFWIFFPRFSEVKRILDRQLNKKNVEQD